MFIFPHKIKNSLPLCHEYVEIKPLMFHAIPNRRVSYVDGKMAANDSLKEAQSFAYPMEADESA